MGPVVTARTCATLPYPNPNPNPNPNQERVGACCDCTHLCYTPLFWDAVFGGLARTVRTAQRGDNQRTGIARSVRIAQRGDNQRTVRAAVAQLPPLASSGMGRLGMGSLTGSGARAQLAGQLHNV